MNYTNGYEPYIQTLLGTAANLCKEVALLASGTTEVALLASGSTEVALLASGTKEEKKTCNHTGMHGREGSGVIQKAIFRDFRPSSAKSGRVGC
jgi:hypothetical protein